MNVLSLFDGISCAQIALNKLGIKVDNYFASEIDTKAIKVTQSNYPNTIQLGNIKTIEIKKLPKIDLLIGGSPCQGFSFAGKKLNFEDPRSLLFFEYVKIKKAIKPKLFLFENVRMKNESLNIISNYLKVPPILINSNLVSAQNRSRNYWCNWKVNQPIDKKIYLKDILQKEDEILKPFKVPNTPSRILMWQGKCKNITNSLKSNCVVTKQDRWNSQGLLAYEDFCRFLTPLENERLQTIPDNYTKVDNLSSKQRDFLIGNSFTVDVIVHILNEYYKN